ncbi:putative iron uptake ABC transporter periplasmic solute-binding protein [Bosea sp. LC85]|uniref:ABC transporter substrate-binding protein n=1 Tax=Bosea sp. LC85 TaxID=1502851 RepID=UPI0004E41AF2|nr:ABC transporter substrate-binding protein [Bosea sp. LC85]KFC64047.1 putative iron uptake ABC transporter periplasmic solute-binding protein [Bosea sp. LC85]
MSCFRYARQASFWLASAALLASSQPAAAQGQVTVYCSILEEQCREGATMFERATGIKVSMVRKSTGEVYAQVKAEASNPRGDVWWGGPGEPHLQAAEEGLLDEYRSPKLAELHDWAQRHAEQSKFRTSGIYLGALGVGFNTEMLKKKGLPEPKCWADLLDPAYRDEVQIADPSSSGTAYVFLATTVQRLGEEKGFDYLKALHKNINQYTKSGIAPVKATALGETAIGIAFIHDMLTQKLQGAPINTVAPCEGTGYETGSVSMIKGGRNAEAARRFIDFTLSPEAQNINAKLKINSIPSNRNAELSPDAPKFSEIKLIDYDTPRWGSPAERSRLLKKFDTEVKALPR